MRACVSCSTWFALSAMNAAFGLSGCFSSSTTWRTAIFFGFVNSGGGWAGTGVGSAFFSSGFFSSGFLGRHGWWLDLLDDFLDRLFLLGLGIVLFRVPRVGRLSVFRLGPVRPSRRLFRSACRRRAGLLPAARWPPRTWFCTLRAKRWMSKRCAMILAVWSAPPLHNRCTTTAVVIHKKSGMFASRRMTRAGGSRRSARKKLTSRGPASNLRANCAGLSGDPGAFPRVRAQARAAHDRHTLLIDSKWSRILLRVPHAGVAFFVLARALHHLENAHSRSSNCEYDAGHVARKAGSQEQCAGATCSADKLSSIFSNIGRSSVRRVLAIGATALTRTP